MRRVVVTPAFGGSACPGYEYDYCVVNLADTYWREIGRMRKRLQGILAAEAIGTDDNLFLRRSLQLSYYSYCHIFITDEQAQGPEAWRRAVQQVLDGSEAVLLNLEGEELEEFDVWWASVDPLPTEVDRVEVTLEGVRWVSVPKRGESPDRVVSADLYHDLLFNGEQDDSE